MVDFEMVKRYERTARANRELWIQDKHSVAQTMRQNLASDIIAGYHMVNVVRQMVRIEDYEETLNYIENLKGE